MRQDALLELKSSLTLGSFLKFCGFFRPQNVNTIWLSPGDQRRQRRGTLHTPLVTQGRPLCVSFSLPATPNPPLCPQSIPPDPTRKMPLFSHNTRTKVRRGFFCCFFFNFLQTLLKRDLIEKIYKAFKGFTTTEHPSLTRGTKASPRLRAEGSQHEHQ